MTSFLIGWPLFCIGILLLILFANWAIGEIQYQRRVCPIWSDTLNVLMDSNVDVVIGHEWCTLGTVRVYIGEYPSDYGHQHGRNDYPDRTTQKRLKEFLAYKNGSDILKKTTDNLNVAKNP